VSEWVNVEGSMRSGRRADLARVREEAAKQLSSQQHMLARAAEAGRVGSVVHSDVAERQVREAVAAAVETEAGRWKERLRQAEESSEATLRDVRRKMREDMEAEVGRVTRLRREDAERHAAEIASIRRDADARVADAQRAIGAAESTAAARAESALLDARRELDDLKLHLREENALRLSQEREALEKKVRSELERERDSQIKAVMTRMEAEMAAERSRVQADAEEARLQAGRAAEAVQAELREQVRSWKERAEDAEARVSKAAKSQENSASEFQTREEELLARVRAAGDEVREGRAALRRAEIAHAELVATVKAEGEEALRRARQDHTLAVEDLSKRVASLQTSLDGKTRELSDEREAFRLAVETVREEGRGAIERKERLIAALRTKLAEAEESERRLREEFESARDELLDTSATSVSHGDDQF
jgi:hypothetical protein